MKITNSSKPQIVGTPKMIGQNKTQRTYAVKMKITNGADSIEKTVKIVTPNAIVRFIGAEMAVTEKKHGVRVLFEYQIKKSHSAVGVVPRDKPEPAKKIAKPAKAQKAPVKKAAKKPMKPAAKIVPPKDDMVHTDPAPTDDAEIDGDDW